MSRKERPVGIAIISILVMLIGLLWILAGLILVAGSVELAELIEDTLGSDWAAIVGILGMIMLIVGILVFLEGLGLWKLNIIAYLIALILLGLDVLGIIVSYDYYLALLMTNPITALINPIITILLFIYFIQVRDHF